MKLIFKIPAIFNTKIFYSISLFEDKEGLEFNILKVEVKGNELNVIEDFKCYLFEDFINKLNNKYPLIVNVEGKEVMSRKVVIEKGYLKKVLFNADPRDFYIQELQLKENQVTYVSVIRCVVLSKFLNSLKERKFLILDVSLGSFGITSLFQFIDGQSISNGFFEISKNDTYPYSYEFRKDKEETRTVYRIDDRSYKGLELNAIAACINYLNVPNEQEFDNKNSLLDVEEYIYKERLKFFGISFLVITLLLVFISHFWNAYLQEKLIEKESLQLVNGQTQKIIEKLKKEKEIKNEIVIESGYNNSRFFYYAILEITNSIPDDILLTELSVYPITSKIRKDKEVICDVSSIEIKGETIYDLKFDKWIDLLQNESWIELVSIEKYVKEKNKNTEFIISIKLVN